MSVLIKKSETMHKMNLFTHGPANKKREQKEMRQHKNKINNKKNKTDLKMISTVLSMKCYMA